MLDELLEYREYTDDSFPQKGRLLVAPILNDKGKGEGVPRALRIIARHFLFTENDYDKSDAMQRAVLREQAVKRLDEWCFGESAYGLRQYVLAESDKAIQEKWQIFEERKRRSWKSEDIYQYLKWETPSFYACSYRLIIADAIEEGPLCRRVLVIDKRCLEKMYYSTDKCDREKAAGSEFGDRAIMLIAAYLLELSSMGSGSRLARLPLADIANWTGYASFSGNKHKLRYVLNFSDDSEEERKNDEPLFSIIDGKYLLNRTFAELYKPRIVTAAEAELNRSEWGDDYLILGDDESVVKQGMKKLVSI